MGSSLQNSRLWIITCSVKMMDVGKTVSGLLSTPTVCRRLSRSLCQDFPTQAAEEEQQMGELWLLPYLFAGQFHGALAHLEPHSEQDEHSAFILLTKYSYYPAFGEKQIPLHLQEMGTMTRKAVLLFYSCLLFPLWVRAPDFLPIAFRSTRYVGIPLHCGDPSQWQRLSLQTTRFYLPIPTKTPSSLALTYCWSNIKCPCDSHEQLYGTWC